MKKISATEIVILIMILSMLGFYISENILQKEIENTNPRSNTSEVTYNNENAEKIEEVENEEDTFENNLEVYYFYVGQGDCILVKNNESSMLIDAGNNKDGKLICNYLKKELGIEKIDYLIGTHAHEDHIGGMDNVINNFEIGKIYMPKKSTTTQTYTEVLDAVEKKGLKINSPKIGEKFNVGDAQCEVVYVDDDAEEINNSSIVISMEFGKQKFLFAGDVEDAVDNKIKLEDIDVLKVAHHGSKTSSSGEFLSQTKPEVAIISLGKNNDYGYPHITTIKKLNNIKADVYRTDTDGTILLTSDGNKNSITKLDVSLDGN